MEKFSKWRDSGTGIQPFLQPVPARTQRGLLLSAFGLIKDYIVGPLLAGVRLTAVAAIAVADCATNALGSLLVVPSVRRAWSRCTRSVLAGLALFVLGFYWVDSKTVGLQKGRRTSKEVRQRGQKKQQRNVSSGDIIIANHLSYIDVLYMVAKYNPVFIEIDNATTYARPVSMWSALRSPARQTPALLQAKDARPLKAITEEARVGCLGPVVVFPENATSNGRALLQFLSVFEEVENQDEKSAIHIMAFKYPFQSFSPAFSVGNQLTHLFRLGCQMYNSMTVRILEQDEAPRIADSAMFCDEDAEPVDLDEAVKAKLLQLSRLRMTKLTAMDKRDFLAFYYLRSKGYRPTI
ncbi:Lysophosphatidic acid:oleoyl-CoA acyltransferase 1 [Coemansia guatemalensis]|uniref:Lysophosphatidic acid:oleoyl-CoA acyltransferase 1 n=1 Tax=Coemansia guatemalensis TaxID=2761395 RepID=A0A9W8HZ93_9FUNG|nr:Lysophosphatidic acid:oleoyl-CoA acyltransferase 1 [Coemansia guatemalensis]